MQQQDAVHRLGENLKSTLTALGIGFGGDSDGRAGRVIEFSTPRRLSLLFEKVCLMSQPFSKEIKGPRISAAVAAINGFLQKHELTSVEQCEVRDVKGHACYFVRLEQPSRKSADLIANAVIQAIRAQSWSKSMRFAHQDFTWVRPLRNILVVLGDECLRGELDLGGGESLPFGEHSFSHRASGNKAVIIKNACDYEEILRHNGVIVSAQQRQDKMLTALKKKFNSHALSFIPDAKAALLQEINGLVEYPHVAMGKIPQRFMSLPRTVLISVMWRQQKYIPCFEKNSENLAKHFAFVANVPVVQQIISGNERVLQARLQDAEFLFGEDMRTPLGEYTEKLKHMHYFEGLGSMHAKVLRLQNLATKLAGLLKLDVALVRDTAYLLKADLMTEMVGEFPDLQGIIGGEYARRQGIDADIASAIETHYQPQNPTAPLLRKRLNVCMALADRLDHLVGFWLIGKQPTSSKDPFALRRAALESMHLLVENNISVSLSQLFTWSADEYSRDYDKDIILSLRQFCHQRYKLLLSQGIKFDSYIIEAVFATGVQVNDNMLDTHHKAEALQKFLKSGNRQGLAFGLKRVANILKDVAGDAAAVQIKFLKDAAEKQLWQAYQNHFSACGTDKDSGDHSVQAYQVHLQSLEKLTPHIDKFFDEVLVHAKSEELRQNRVNLLKAIHQQARKIADFSRLPDFVQASPKT